MITCDFIPDELTALHLPDGGEERADLLMRHRLRQVVDNQVGLPVALLAVRLGPGGQGGGEHLAHPGLHHLNIESVPHT